MDNERDTTIPLYPLSPGSVIEASKVLGLPLATAAQVWFRRTGEKRHVLKGEFFYDPMMDRVYCESRKVSKRPVEIALPDHYQTAVDENDPDSEVETFVFDGLFVRKEDSEDGRSVSPVSEGHPGTDTYI